MLNNDIGSFSGQKKRIEELEFNFRSEEEGVCQAEEIKNKDLKYGFEQAGF